MEKLFIKNRKGQKLAVIVEKGDPEKGLVFITHGLGGFKEQEQIVAFSETFTEKGFTAVRFDTSNTFGESEGNYEDATFTSHYEDLEDVIEWASDQGWYKEPFYLIGHSLGAMASVLYAQRHIGKVKALFPISVVVSGSLSADAYKKFNPEMYETWEKTGWNIQNSNSRPGVVKKLKWSHMIDRLQYDLLPGASLLTMPVVMITGKDDPLTPPEHVEKLFKAIPHGVKHHDIIPGAPHTFRDPQHLAEIKKLVGAWVVSLEDKK